MRKLFSLFVALLATTSLWALYFEGDGIYYNSLDGTNVEVTYRGDYPSSYDEYSGEVIIPSTVRFNGITYSVTSIGDYAFEYCSSLTSVTIPNSVTSIGESAFESCSSLTSVTIPESVTRIGDYAFESCSSLTSITIPSSVTSIGDGAFYWCSSLSSVTIPNSVTSIGVRAFYGCYSLTSVTIGNSVTSIGEDAFYGCSSLSSITIPESVTSIGEDAFYECSALTSITIPESVTSIGYGAFMWCSFLTSVTINSDAIVNKTHSSSSNISDRFGSQVTEYIIGDDVKGIGDYAFYGSSSLTSVTIPNSVTSIGEDAFYNCSSLTSITIPSRVTSIGGSAFYGCSSLTKTNYTGDIAGWCNIMFGGNYANPMSYSHNFYINDQEIKDLVIPNNVTSIGSYAFYNCSSLTSVTIGNSVTSIGRIAFEDCSSLTSITIPESVTSIGRSAFDGCSSLEYLYIPNSVQYSDQYPEEVHYYDGYSSIMNCPNLKTLIVPADFFAVDGDEVDYQLTKSKELPYLPERLESLTINDGTIHRLAWDFINRNYKTLKTIDLATTTDIAIAEEAFKNCYKLENLALPSQLEYIPYMAIAECVKLQSITIPATVTEIEDRAFENCRSIKSIIFEGAAPAQGPAHHAAATGSSLWRIGSWTFYNCHQLQNLTIPEGVTEVGDAAFYGCTYLEDMVLPSTIQEIGDNGFALCAKLKKIHVKAATPPTIQAKTFFDVNRQIPVYVPDNAVEAYKDDPYWQEFDIQGESKAPSAVDNIPSAVTNTQKIMRNGQLIILRDGVEYNAIGQEL